MGKKVKTGKLRRDKFYHLAKESGFRSRAAFKLLQLNREHRFLEKSRVCIDLCAAPGGWLQVAEKHMPVSSLIIGIDLVPIKPIPNTITYQEDITSEKCRQLLKKDLGTFKADVILHDGAPNVGKNWIHDAYQQNVLTLSALKLATEYLRKGGSFITKVFRSKDYYALLWVFQQMFKKVDSTKPQASRNESAEIFVICHGYLAPDKIDPKFLDYKHVFTEVEIDSTEHSRAKLLLKHPEKVIRSREGYPEGDYTLYHTLEATKFIQSEQFLDLLATSNKIIIDDERILKHPATTKELKLCLEDIKVLGKREIKLILTWRKKLAAALHKADSKTDSTPNNEKTSTDMADINQEEQKVQDDIEDKEDKDIEEQLLRLNEQQRKEAKRKRKHVMKEKRKLRDRLALKMVLPGDIHDHEASGGNKNDQGLFDLEKIKTKKQLLEISSALPDMNIFGKDNDDENEINEFGLPKSVMYFKDKDENYAQLDIYKQYLDDEENTDNDDNIDAYDSERKQPKLDHLESDTDGDDQKENEWDDMEDADEEENPLDKDILTAETKKEKSKAVADVWFEQDIFKDAINEFDEDFEIERKLYSLKKNGRKILNKTNINTDNDTTKQRELKGILKTSNQSEITNGKDSDEDGTDDDSDNKQKKKKKKRLRENEFEEVPINQPMKRVRLDAEELALGHVMAQSKANREQVVDHAFNRFMGFGDIDGLPAWFVDEEKQHCRGSLPITKEVVERYRAKMREINERPTKKVAEAKARKKRREIRKLEKVKKKAEPVLENPDITDQERNKHLKGLYKKYGVIGQKKAKVQYVVAKKYHRGSKPAGTKAPYKIVDKRLKKDKRAVKSIGKKSKGNKRTIGRKQAKQPLKRKKRS